MRGTRIKQYFNGIASDREYTRQHWCSLRKIKHGSEVELALFHLHGRLLALIALLDSRALTLLIGLVLLRFRALIGIMPRLPQL